VATDPPVGKKISQEVLDLLCTVGGIASPWLRQHNNALLLSHVPGYASGMFKAWTAVGGLSLTKVYHVLDELLLDIQRAKLSCGSDNRIILDADAHYECSPRPSSGAGSSMQRSWMYCFTGDVLLGVADGDTKALAFLRMGVNPRIKSANRDLETNNYCRFLGSLKAMAATKSSFIRDALVDPLTPKEEAAEYVADL
jgi:hypothetical protein